MNEKVFITANELTKVYKSKKNPDVQAVKGVSFSLPDKGMVFILGKSGCGKSTLLNLLGGLDSFDSGDICVDGKSMKDFSASDYDNYRNNRIGFVFQENNLLNEYSVKHNVGLALDLKREKHYEQKLTDVLKSVDLEEFAGRKCNRLSGGQKQRVAIARAIVKSPQLLLCDEPTGALDSETGEEIFNLLKKISAQTLVVVVSHDREAAEAYGDRVIELKDGKIISDTFDGSYDAKGLINSPVKKSGLPAKRAFSYGAGFLIARPMRFILCVIICILTFTFLGISDTIASYDRAGAVANAIEKYKTPNFTFTKKIATNCYDGIELYQRPNIMSDDDCEILKSITKVDRFDKVYCIDAYYNDYGYGDDIDFNKKYEAVKEIEGVQTGWIIVALTSMYACNGFVEFDQSFSEDYGFTLYGNYPDAYDEVVIPLHLFKGLQLKGYFDYSTWKRTPITEYSDIIGKTLTVNTFTFKVVGIIDTKVNVDYYGDYFYNGASLPEDDEKFSQAWQNLTEYGTSNLFYCAPGFYENVFLKGENVKANQNAYDIKCLISPDNGSYSARKYNAGIRDRYKKPFEGDNILTYTLDTPESILVDIFINDDMMFYGYTFKYMSIALVVLTSLFVLYFTSGIVAEKKREIGILRALGASRFDVIKIFSAQNGIFAAGIIAVSTILGIIGAIITNSLLVSQFGLPMVIVSFAIRQFGLLLGVAVGAILIGCIIPIIRLLFKKPVDIIAGR